MSMNDGKPVLDKEAPKTKPHCITCQCFNTEISPAVETRALFTLDTQPGNSNLVTELREWAAGLNPEHFSGTIKYLRLAADELARTNDRDDLYRLAEPPRLVYDGPLSAFDPEMELPPAESGKGDGT